ncbi:MAG: AgmX/PglI C-terminal domain-containing protein [Myxococcota bacterium]
MTSIVLLVAISASEPVCPADTTKKSITLSDKSVTSTCNDSTGVPHGPLWNTRGNGRLRWIERYRRGRPHGTWVKFARNGGLIERRDFNDGVMGGTWERFYDDGKPRLSGSFVDGRKNGEFKGWHRSGKVAFQARFVDGRADGDWLLFARSGALQARCRYEKGVEKKRELFALERALETSDVLQRLTDMKNSVKFCYDRELSLRPDLKSQTGRFDFRAVVTPAGLTAEVALDASTLEDARLQACVADVIEQMIFPRLTTCELVDVALPWLMSPEG